jgi:diguanylate cyclase (GGDEF)-like protein/PAS domain S-box-containing protein
MLGESSPEDAVKMKKLALKALRDGDFDFALKAVQRGEANIPDMVEDLKIYQAELEVQNEELRDAQQHAEKALRRFDSLFSTLPLPALEMDEFGVISECNDKAEEFFELDRNLLCSHFFPRLLAKHEQLRLRRAIAQAKVDGDGSMLEVQMQTSGDSVVIADIFLSLLPMLDAKASTSHFAVMLADQTQRRAQQVQLLQRVKELRAVYAISRAAQHISTEAEFFSVVFESLPSGVLYPEDARVQITLPGRRYTSQNYCEPLQKMSVPIMVAGVEKGKLSLGYAKMHSSIDGPPFCAEERLLVAGVTDLIGRFIEGMEDKLAHEIAAKRNMALLELTTGSSDMNDEELVRYALDQAEKMTSSAMAYAHFVNDDQETITLGGWSTATLTHCHAEFDSHYPISKAGVWADCFRQRQSIIHNDYAALTQKKGLPEGHAPLLRHVSVPVYQGDKVAMIFGVGNKRVDYDDGDLALVEVLANNLWVLLQRNRSVHKLKLDAEVFRVSREAVVITDATGNIVSVNNAFTEITGYAAAEVIGQNPRMLKSGKQDALFFKSMWEQIQRDGHWQGEIWNRRKNGEIYPEWLGITMTKNSANEVSEYIGIFMDISEHKEAQQRIEHLGYYDPLTNLANRRLLKDRTKQAISQAQRQEHMVGLIYLDLDHFKDVNDSLGHLVGDELLRLVSERLISCVRDADTVCRMGGDEFVVLLTRVETIENVADACSKILSALSDVYLLTAHTIRISSSMGASIYPADGASFDELLQYADTAMYQAKAAGRGNFKLFTEAMNQRVQHRLRLQTQMKNSLASNEFYLQYQPQFDLEQQRITGVEALVRWQHPELGNIPPSEFIPVAEESNLIVAIGNFVMREACMQAKRWLDAGYRLGIAVNVSFAQFAQQNLLRSVMDILHETQLPPDLLDLELTESILISDPEQVLLVVDQLVAMGVKFSIDDFGTGYSSLSYLKRFSVHKLKIDQSFVRDLLTDPSDAVIVSAIINMAHNLQMQSIAEGVETPEQAMRLRELGCQQIQGYYFSRPILTHQMDALLAAQR